MASVTAIAATTDAATSSLITLSAGQSIQVHASQLLEDGEKVTFDQSPDDGTTWQRVYDSDRNGVLLENNITLSGTVSRAIVTGPGDFRLNKTKTDNAVAVYYDQ